MSITKKDKRKKDSPTQDEKKEKVAKTNDEKKCDYDCDQSMTVDKCEVHNVNRFQKPRIALDKDSDVYNDKTKDLKKKKGKEGKKKDEEEGKKDEGFEEVKKRNNRKKKSPTKSPGNKEADKFSMSEVDGKYVIEMSNKYEGLPVEKSAAKSKKKNHA